jgi:hypothetical protein
LAERGYARIESLLPADEFPFASAERYSRDPALIAPRTLTRLRLDRAGLRELPRHELRTGWYRPGGEGEGLWIADEATARLACTADSRGAAHVRFFADVSYHGGKPFEVTLRVGADDRESITVDRTDVFELTTPLPAHLVERCGNEPTLVDLTIRASSTFVPADVFDTIDRSPKSILVLEIGVR